ncbi:hypothetical protein [Streptomyces sp. or20]|uniref:hypothetical protein n=1 Tax=Streptomyces sp. or20 TaxID=1828016 RepID=UPI000BF1FCD2|nr:hypothetical protein [Streptomyces sp. or20]
MGRGVYLAMEASGMVLPALATPVAIHGVLDGKAEQGWWLLDQVPGGLVGQTVLLGLVAILGIAYGGWAHLQLQPSTEQGAPSA